MSGLKTRTWNMMPNTFKANRDSWDFDCDNDGKLRLYFEAGPVYVYQAALLCESCGERRCEELTAAGTAPADPSDEHTYDSDDFPKGPTETGSSDSLSFCDHCGKFLPESPTREGWKAIIETLDEYLVTGRVGDWTYLLACLWHVEEDASEPFDNSLANYVRRRIEATHAEHVSDDNLRADRHARIRALLVAGGYGGGYVYGWDGTSCRDFDKRAVSRLLRDVEEWAAQHRDDALADGLSKLRDGDDGNIGGRMGLDTDGATD